MNSPRPAQIPPTVHRRADPRPARRTLAAGVIAILAHPFPAAAVQYVSSNSYAIAPPGMGTSEIYGINGTQAAGYGATTGTNHYSGAVLWNESGTNWVPLSAAGYQNTWVTSLAGTQQAGYAAVGTTSTQHAMLWNGAAASAVDLNPAGYSASWAYGTNGSQQVGYGYGLVNPGNFYHAVLWNGSPSKYVDLNPTGFSQSYANAISANQQVGYGYGTASGLYDHALLWTGSASTAIDLHPASGAFRDTYANGVAGNQQVGRGRTPGDYPTGGFDHALLWSGSAASVIDLHPLSNWRNSIANATNGSIQVGYVDNGGLTDAQAAAWFGIAASFVNLGHLLTGTVSNSFATSIDSYGNVGGYASFNGGGYTAVVWAAGDLYNTANNGTSWNAPATWRSGAPSYAANTLLISSDGAARTVTYDNPDPVPLSARVGDLTVDATNAGSMTLALPQYTLTSFSDSIGFVGTGSLSQTGGTHKVLGALTLGVKPGSAGTYSLSGNSALSAATVVLGAGGAANFVQSGGTATFTSLTISPASRYTLAAGALILDYASTSPAAQVRSYLAAHLLSTPAAAPPDTRLAYVDSAALPAARWSTPTWTLPDATTLLITPALTGDANLDGAITPDDYALLDRSLAVSRTNATWTDGDFNYDGVIDQNDYLLIDSTHLKAQGSFPGSLLAQRDAQFGAGYVARLTAALPEPSAPLACLIATPLLRRRRKS